MDLSANISMTQSQAISQNMIQSMSILQMSAVELLSYLQELSLENPVIELPEAEGQDKGRVDLQRKMEWLASTDSQNRVYYQQDQDESFLHGLKEEERLSDYLLSQLILHDYSRQDYEIIEYMILSLDGRGYFTDGISHVSRQFGVPEPHVEGLLKEVQKLDPAGVGARDIRECLLLQLSRREEGCPVAEQIISEHLAEVAKNHLHEIARKMSISTHEASLACEVIRSLNPKPGSGFSDRENLRYISPDVLVVKTGESLEILVNEYQYPKFSISEYYAHLMQETSDEEARQYLQEKMAQAKWVATCISRRATTLSNVAHALVEWQQLFFLQGKGYRRRMRLSDLAEALGLHESTVSRAMKGKYLQCAWGIFPMNYFLSSAALRQSDPKAFPEAGEATADGAKSLLRELIEQEDKAKPYSDQALADLLKERGVAISRRTVNKYRQEMGIPDKTGRKSWR